MKEQLCLVVLALCIHIVLKVDMEVVTDHFFCTVKYILE